MSRIAYIDKAFRPDSLVIIAQANGICEDYQAQGYDLTLRQVYYQFVARGLLANSDRNYKRLGSIINDARLAGLMDWSFIRDRTRFLRSQGYWEDPEQIIDASARGFQRNLWIESGQHYRPEVWVEKDALIGIVEQAASPLHVPHLSCRGYVSQSEMFSAGRRMRQHFHRGHTPVVIHLGDHDPSGIDMSRDIQDRLSLFAGQRVDVRRIALNMDQVEQYDPPPNPAKLTDSRGADYVDRFGDDSWELDALEPSVLTALIQEAVAPLIDQEAWDYAESVDQHDRDRMTAVASRWTEVDENWDQITDLLDGAS